MLVAGVLGGCSGTGGKDIYATAPITRGDLRHSVTASGTLSAVVSVDVGSQVSGKISTLLVDFNSPVKKGQLLAEIDPTVYMASLRQAEGELDSAKASALLKEQNLARKQVLLPQRAATQFDLDQATAELAQARSSVVIRQAALDSARANLGYCKITSPVDGVVISRKVDLGQTVAAAMSTPVLFTIAQDITQMHISAPVSEADIGLVKVGQSIEFGVDAFQDETFKGEVIQVRRAPTTISNVVTYETIIRVANPERRLFPGMTANVSIRVAERSNVLLIANSALRFSPPADTRFEQPPPTQLAPGLRLVYRVGSDPATLRPLQLRTGITDGINTEVLEGITAAESVVTSLRDSAAGNAFGGPGGDGDGPPL